MNRKVRRIRADLERISTTAVVEVAEALANQNPGLSPAMGKVAALQLLEETARRLRAGERVAFATRNADGTYSLDIPSSAAD